MNYKLGRTKEFSGILLFDTVYTDSNKGLKASKEELMEAFGSVDVEEISKAIIERGEVLIKTEQKRSLMEEKKRRIISHISRNCIDVRTGAPIPPLRIERAMEEVDLRIDPFAHVEEQMAEILKKLMEVIPIRQQTTKIQIKIPSTYVGKAYGLLKESGEIVGEEWLRDGSCMMKVVIPSGIKTRFIDRLSSLTRGTAYPEIVEEKGA